VIALHLACFFLGAYCLLKGTQFDSRARRCVFVAGVALMGAAVIAASV
jgi:hypothetical protein